jgi:hypothetical protein
MRLVLVRHAMPEIDPTVPAHRWRLGADGRAAARTPGPLLPAGAYPVVGTHGMAMTVWLATRVDLDPAEFWAALRFPDMIEVDLAARTVSRRMP